MAKGRMLHKDISTSETVNSLPAKSCLVYTWMIPHMDDKGYICKSPKKLKAIIFPMKEDIIVADIETALKEGMAARDQYGIPLILEFSDCYQLPGAIKRQSISKATPSLFEAKKTGESNNPPKSPEFPQIHPNFPKTPQIPQSNRTEQNTTEGKGIELNRGGKESIPGPGSKFSTLQLLLSVGLSQKSVSEVMKAYSMERIAEVLKMSEGKTKRAGFIVKALREGWKA